MRKLAAGIAAIVLIVGCSSSTKQSAGTDPIATVKVKVTATGAATTTQPATTTTTIAKASRQAAVAVQQCIDAISTGMFADVLQYQDPAKLDTFETVCKNAQTELEVDGGSQVGGTPINKLKLYIATRLKDVAVFKLDALDGATPKTYPVAAELFQWETDMKALLDATR